MFKLIQIYFLLFGLSVIAGCGQPTVQFSGTVTFSDGSPVTFGTVNFDSGTHTFLGHIDANGRYAPGINQQGRGIPEGIYRVWLTGTETGNNVTSSDGTITQGKATPNIDAKFCQPATSGLTFEAKPNGVKTFDIVVERPKKH
jgi:hypothetical protein